MHVSYRSGILLAAPPAVCGPRSAVRGPPSSLVFHFLPHSAFSVPHFLCVWKSEAVSLMGLG